MTRKFLIATVACGLTALSTFAQSAVTDSATQQFTVTIPKKVDITAPVAVTKIYDPTSILVTESSPSFPTQTWGVRGNVRNGVTVSFSAPVFASTVGTFKANTGLAISYANAQGPAVWTVNTASHATDYGASTPVNTATVAAYSDGVGRADFNLVVSFMPVDFELLGEGDYVTTVTGTVTER